MADLGFMAQAAATLRRYEYSGLIVKWLDDNLSSDFGNEFLDRDQAWHLKGEFALAQTLIAIAQIGADDPGMAELIHLARIEEKITPIFEIMEQDFGVEHVPIIPALFWSLHVLDLDSAISDKFEQEAIDLTL